MAAFHDPLNQGTLVLNTTLFHDHRSDEHLYHQPPSMTPYVDVMHAHLVQQQLQPQAIQHFYDAPSPMELGHIAHHDYGHQVFSATPWNVPSQVQQVHDPRVPGHGEQLTAPKMEQTDSTCRPRLTPYQTNYLEKQFDNQQKPTTAEKEDMARYLQLPRDRINNWFQNRRAKRKHNDKSQRTFDVPLSQEFLHGNFNPPVSPPLDIATLQSSPTLNDQYYHGDSSDRASPGQETGGQGHPWTGDNFPVGNNGRLTNGLQYDPQSSVPVGPHSYGNVDDTLCHGTATQHVTRRDQSDDWAALDASLSGDSPTDTVCRDHVVAYLGLDTNIEQDARASDSIHEYCSEIKAEASHAGAFADISSCPVLSDPSSQASPIDNDALLGSSYVDISRRESNASELANDLNDMDVKSQGLPVLSRRESIAVRRQRRPLPFIQKRGYSASRVGLVSPIGGDGHDLRRIRSTASPRRTPSGRIQKFGQETTQRSPFRSCFIEPAALEKLMHQAQREPTAACQQPLDAFALGHPYEVGYSDGSPGFHEDWQASATPDINAPPSASYTQPSFDDIPHDMTPPITPYAAQSMIPSHWVDPLVPQSAPAQVTYFDHDVFQIQPQPDNNTMYIAPQPQHAATSSLLGQAHSLPSSQMFPGASEFDVLGLEGQCARPSSSDARLTFNAKTQGEAPRQLQWHTVEFSPPPAPLPQQSHRPLQWQHQGPDYFKEPAKPR